jgi:hypothetical protein
VLMTLFVGISCAPATQLTTYVTGLQSTMSRSMQSGVYKVPPAASALASAPAKLRSRLCC